MVVHSLNNLTGWKGSGLLRGDNSTACASARTRGGSIRADWLQEAEAQRRRDAAEPMLRVPITSELGNVTPAFLVPGEWEPESVANVAKLIAFNMLDNAGCNCLTPRVVVMAADWPQVRLPPPAPAPPPPTPPAGRPFTTWLPGAPCYAKGRTVVDVFVASAPDALPSRLLASRAPRSRKDSRRRSTQHA